MEIVYQPIVNLQDGATVGYEALTRFSGEPPEEVFKQAWSDGEDRGVALEVQAAEMALRSFRPEEDDAYLSINASAKTIVATEGELIKAPDLEVPWDKIVVELTEHDKVEMTKHEGDEGADYLSMHRPLSFLRDLGTELAVDDLGGESATLSDLFRILNLMPHILKVDRMLVHHVDDSPIRRTMIKAIVGIASDIHSKVVAEGIETEAEREWCAELGVDCGQGYLFGKPEPFPQVRK